MESDRLGLRQGAEHRHVFIDFHLFWEGQIDCSDMVGYFGVSMSRASTDLNRYIGLAPEDMVYDSSARTDVRGSLFQPQLHDSDARQIFPPLRSIANGMLDSENSRIAHLPPYAATPTPLRSVDPVTPRSQTVGPRRAR